MTYIPFNLNQASSGNYIVEDCINTTGEWLETGLPIDALEENKDGSFVIAIPFWFVQRIESNQLRMRKK